MNKPKFANMTEARENDDQRIINNGLYVKPVSVTFSKSFSQDGSKIKFFRVRDFGAGGVKKDIACMAKVDERGKLTWTIKPDAELLKALVDARLLNLKDLA